VTELDDQLTALSVCQRFGEPRGRYR